MNLTYLKYFLVLARSQHYGKAAELLGISQPGLSHAMAALEKELGMPLFKKDGRNIALNRFGKFLVPEAEKVLSVAERCQEQFRLLRSGGGPLRIGAIRPLTVTVVPELARAYVLKAGEQGQKFQFFTGVSSEVIDGLKQGIYDIGFCSMLDKEPDLLTGREENLRAIPIRSPKWENTYYLARRKNDCRSRLEEEFFCFCKERMRKDMVECGERF